MSKSQLTQPLKVDNNPCSSCPYRRDTPPGVWDATEYEKLRLFDTNDSIAVFLCHHSPVKGETACSGWLAVHAESVAVRLAVLRGLVTNDQRYRPVTVPLYRSGDEAAVAGMRGIQRPGDRARRMIMAISRTRKNRRGAMH